MVRTAIAELSFDEKSGLLHIRMLKGADMSLESSQAHYEAILELTGGKDYLALVDASEYFTISPEALRYTSLPGTIGRRIATAYYQASIGNKLTLDFFRKYHKPHIPLGVFNTREEATEWLLVQKDPAERREQ